MLRYDGLLQRIWFHSHWTNNLWPPLTAGRMRSRTKVATSIILHFLLVIVSAAPQGIPLPVMRRTKMIIIRMWCRCWSMWCQIPHRVESLTWTASHGQACGMDCRGSFWWLPYFKSENVLRITDWFVRLLLGCGKRNPWITRYQISLINHSPINKRNYHIQEVLGPPGPDYKVVSLRAGFGPFRPAWLRPSCLRQSALPHTS